MQRIALVALVLGVLGCPKPLPPSPPPPGPIDGPATCADMCRRLGELRCPGVGTTPEGATCEEVCTNVQESGLGALDLECRARAASCEAAEACEANQ